eukprot:scaffold160632_cov39-Tisochrysis_lutea.AAC.1
MLVQGVEVSHLLLWQSDIVCMSGSESARHCIEHAEVRCHRQTGHARCRRAAPRQPTAQSETHALPHGADRAPRCHPPPLSLSLS